MTKTAALAKTAPQTGIEHFDVVIVGAGISGVGGAITSASSAQERVLSSSKPRKASAARGSPTAIPASVPTATSTPLATASSHGPARRSPRLPRSSAIWAKSSTRTISVRTSAIATRSSRHPGRAATTAGRSRLPGRTPAKASASPPAFCGCARVIIVTQRATRPSGWGWRITAAGSSTRRSGPRIWTTPANGSS